MSFTRIEPTSIDTTETFTFRNVSVNSNTVTNNLTVNNTFSTQAIDITTRANLGPVANLKITGGSANLALVTDGTGNLRWDVPAIDSANTVRTAAQPNITSVGTLTSFAANNGTLTSNVPYTFTSNWNSALTTFTALEVRVTDTLSTAGSALLNLTVGGTSRFSVNKLGNIAANTITVSGNVAAAFVSGTITTAAQPNITSIGQLSVLGVTSNINAGNLIVSGGLYGPLNGTIGAITPSIGTFTNVVVNNNITASGNVVATNANLGNAVRANFFIGDGGFLSNVITTGSVSANYANFANVSNIASTVTTAAQPNITSVGTLTGLTLTGNANLGNAVRSNFFIGNGSLLTSVAAGSISGQVPNALVSGTVYTAAQPNITSVGTLTSLTAGNATVTGTFTANSLLTSSSREKINYFTTTGTFTSATLNTNLGAVWWINNPTSMGDPFTINFSNVAVSTTETIVFVVMVSHGAVPHPITQVQINGSTELLKWLGGITPSGFSNSLDVYSFTLIPTTEPGYNWIVAGQYNTYF